RFEKLGDMSDLNESVLNFQQAVQLSPVGHPDKPSWLNNFGNSLFTRFEELRDMTDLNESILKLQEAIELAPDDHPSKPSFLYILGGSLLKQFEQSGDITHLNESVLQKWEALRLIPHHHPDKPSWLNNLGNLLLTRFEHLRDETDLKNSLLIIQGAVELSPDGHFDEPSRWNNLGNSSLTVFERFGVMADFNLSLIENQQVVQLTPDGHPDKPSWLNKLGNSLLTQFGKLRDITDLNESVLKFQQAVLLTPDGDPEKSSRLTNLGTSLLTRVEELGDMADINESILKFQEAVQLTPDDHPDKPSRLNQLGSSFLRRFEQLGDMADLNESVLQRQEAVQLAPDGHPDMPSFLNNLGNSLLTQFERFGDSTDLNKCVLKFQQAVQLTPDHHYEKASRLNNLGNSLLTKFEQFGDMTDLNESILKTQEALQLTPANFPDKPLYLITLGNSLFRRFKRLGDITDLNESSVLKLQEAIELAPDGHPSKPSILYNLGGSLFTRFEQLGLPHDIVSATSMYSSAACAKYGPPSLRLFAAHCWAMCLRVSQFPLESILSPYHIAIPLLSEMVWLGSSLPDRHHQIMQAGNVVHEAAAAAHKIGNDIQAVEWLEQGRSVIWGQLLQLHTPLDDLQEKEPELSQKLKLNSLQLEEAASHQNFTHEINPAQAGVRGSVLSNEELAHQGHTLAIERQQLLKEIRMCPGFENFLLPRSITELAPAASHGPIILLNFSELYDMCHALILLPNSSGSVLPVTLELFPASQAQLLYRRLQKLLHEDGQTMVLESDESTVSHGFKEILAELWERVAKPVLNALKLTKPSPKSKPHVWWCPTGFLSFLPLHAAGLYHTGAPPSSKLSDFVISSYTPTISACLDRVSPLSSPPRPPKLLVIAQPSSFGQQNLPGTVEEVKYIEQVIEGALTVKTLIRENATLENVISELKTSAWVHFACHGVQDHAHPTKSALLLAGNARLTLANIASLKITPGGLAFLSACQTAKGDEQLSDEAVHLSAGMLASGFGGVIATMWSVTDKFAPKVARDVYKHLKESELDITEAAHALQLAVEKSRKDMPTDNDASFVSWVPFIHMG
ncbi:hypothetical protein M422DRAFT_80447, partial [Sphaerobolus stellatus SS14]